MQKMNLQKDDILCNKLRIALKEEWKDNYKNGVYGYLQKVMACNSNHIEGSTLTQDQTSMLFDTKTLSSEGELYRAKDIEEAQGHFLAFNHLIKTLDEKLSEQLIKAFHYCLKAGVFEDRANGYAIGEYKTKPNVAGDTETVLPQFVQQEMKKLIEWYQHSEKTLATLAEFHASFEKIHPFQDGNGRVGRLILFRECVVNNIIPFIIKGEQRLRYIKAIKAAHEKDLKPLADLFVEDQKELQEKLNYFFYDENNK